jgi:thiol-disulfide isomerase/thioredoxin/tetratricopeptide (TPR) repeat protein
LRFLRGPLVVVAILALAEASSGAEVPAGVWVERGVAAMGDGRPGDALAAARAALRANPESPSAWDLYLRASERVGASGVARAEVTTIVERRSLPGAAPAVAAATLAAFEGGREAMTSDAPVWMRADAAVRAGDAAAALLMLDDQTGPDVRRARVTALVASERYGAALAEARRGVNELPSHPDQVLGLWYGRSVDKSFDKGRLKLARSAVAAAPGDDVLALWRARATAVRAGLDDVAASLGKRLEALGEPRPTLDRVAWNSRMQQELGTALAQTRQPKLPVCTPDEAIGIATGASAALAFQGRDEDAVAVWAALWERVRTPEVGLGFGRALLEVDRPADARGPLVDAAAAVALPDASDSYGLARDRRAQRTAAILAALARALVPEDPAAAWRYGTLAIALDPRPDYLRQRSDLTPPPVPDAFDATSFDHALRALGREALADPAAAIQSADALIAAVCTADEPVEACAPLAAEVLAERAAASRALGDAAGALAAYDIAILLVPRAEWLARRGDLLWAAGAHDAAFGAWAVAWADGMPLTRELEGAYAGPSRWDVAARAADAAWDAAEPDRSGHDAPAVTIGFGGAVGEPLPDLSSCRVDDAPMSAAGLAGAPVVVMFWASWCGPCHDLFADLKGLTDEWGASVRVLAVSADDEQRAYARGLAELHPPDSAAVCRAPALGAAFQVRSLPTVWVFDAEGRATGRVVGYSSTAAADVRRLVEQARAPAR